MKKFIVFLVFLMSFGAIFAQQRVIVVMNDKYDNAQLARKTQGMTKSERRDFVIQERVAFCQASQQDVMEFLNGLKDEVSRIEQYWAFNGFRCDASEEVILMLEKRTDVAYVYRDEKRKMVPDFVETSAAGTRDLAWHVSKVNAPQVWSYNGSTGYNGNGVVVAVVDSGVDYNHIDIAGSMWNGGTDFPHHGYDVCNNDNDPMDDYCHGTHVAGIVAGQGNAGTQTGIAPGAKIMAVKVLDDTGYGSDADLITGVEFAVEHGADIITETAPVSALRPSSPSHRVASHRSVRLLPTHGGKPSKHFGRWAKDQSSHLPKCFVQLSCIGHHQVCMAVSSPRGYYVIALRRLLC